MPRGFIRVYRTYNFIDKNPVIDKMRTIIDDEGLMKKLRLVHELSGVATSTLNNMFSGKTRSPQHSTIGAISTSLGYEEQFVKVKKLDYESEREVALKWLARQEKKKAAAAKPNGSRKAKR